jgi:hypothetical protein
LMIVLTNAMEQSPLEADSSSAAREIRRVLWNSKFRYCVYKASPLLPVLS